MPYDRTKHHRRSIRLPGYDYTSPGAYFVTLCVQRGQCLQGQVVDGEMRLNQFGQAAGHYWKRIPLHSDQAQLDAWVVMPNHLHGIIVISGRGGASLPSASSTGNLTTGKTPLSAPGAPGDAAPLRKPGLPPGLQSGSLGAIIGNYKSVSTRRINRLRDTPGVPFWQRNYWEHVIRNDQSLDRIREYIGDNPARWPEDQLHPDAPPNQWVPPES